jgi:hypothetical protein
MDLLFCLWQESIYTEVKEYLAPVVLIVFDFYNVV